MFYILYILYITRVVQQVENTSKDFKGDQTLVVFSLLKITRLAPETTCQMISKKNKQLGQTIFHQQQISFKKSVRSL